MAKRRPRIKGISKRSFGDFAKGLHSPRTEVAEVAEVIEVEEPMHSASEEDFAEMEDYDPALDGPLLFSEEYGGATPYAIESGAKVWHAGEQQMLFCSDERAIARWRAGTMMRSVNSED